MGQFDFHDKKFKNRFKASDEGQWLPHESGISHLYLMPE